MPLMVKVKTRKTRTEQGAFGPREIEETVTESRPLKAPKGWAMYEPAGNHRLKEIAEKAIRAVEAAVEIREVGAIRHALVRFLVDWELLGYEKGFEEASDTAVREMVGNFHDKLAKASGFFEGYEIDEMWEKNRDKAYREVSRIRADKKKGEAQSS
jgi:hypothetical protein